MTLRESDEKQRPNQEALRMVFTKAPAADLALSCSNADVKVFKGD